MSLPPRTLNILVFPCGSEIGLEVYNSLIVQKNIKLFGASSVDDNGKFVFKNYIGGVPLVDEENFINFIKDIVKIYDIDAIFPCVDIVIGKLKNHEKEIQCKILSSPIETVEVASRKSLTYKHFRDLVRTPSIIDVRNPEFPLFSKPDIGASSRNTLKVENELDLQYAIKKYPRNLLLEYLPGDEFTIDCFTDKRGKLLFVGPRKRARISNGISVGVKPVVDKKINEIAEIINNSLSFRGAWFFQLKKDKNEEYCLLEIAVRFGGSSVINRISGVNFAYLTLLNEYVDVSVFKNNYDIEVGRSLDIKTITNLEYDKVYLDFDDTLIINDLVNLDAIHFIYKCLNAGIEVILITKHQQPIEESLKKYRIEPTLFSKIIQLEQKDHKYKYIESKKSIFVDDSFKELMDAQINLNIPVISVENIKHL